MFVLALVIGHCAADSSTEDTVELYHRCGYCNEGYCEPGQYMVGKCTTFCDPCHNYCSGSYNLTRDSENNYHIATYDDANCVATRNFSSQVYCDTCFYYEDTTFCPAFYIRCPSYWWAWTMGTIIVVVLVVLGVVFVIGYLKRKQISTALSGTVEKVSYSEAVHQSTGYQAPPSSFD